MLFEQDYLEAEPTRAEVDRIAGPVLVEFGAPWCPHCHAIQPELAALLNRHPGVRHIKVEDSQGMPLGRSFQVKLWPNLVFLKDGRVVRQLARPGVTDIRRAMEELLSFQIPGERGA